jgi:AcrR family transcriptional regulator
MQVVARTSVRGERSRRQYTSARREQQAAQTRSDVLGAAVELFRTSGWARTTMAAIAERAGVAVETVYSGFGSKAALLRAAFDVALVGDAEPVPLVERPEFRRLSEGSLEERLQAGMDLVTDIYERSAGVWRAIRDAAGGDEELEQWRTDTERRRRVDLRRGLEEIVRQPIDGAAFDVLWVLFGPQAYLDLVQDAGLSRSEYQRCIAEALVRLTRPSPLRNGGR